MSGAVSESGGTEDAGHNNYTYRRDNQGALVSERLPSGAIYYYSFDGLGSVTALTDTAGTAQALYSYEPYGETTASGPAPNTANPWKYTSSYLDTTGFYKMGMRYYAPGLMRWTQQDPLEQPTDAVQANRYGYAGDNPISHADPMGTCIVLSCDTWDDVGDVATEGAAGAVSGALGGAVAGSPGGLPGVAAGAATGALEGFGVGVAGGVAKKAGVPSNVVDTATIFYGSGRIVQDFTKGIGKLLD